MRLHTNHLDADLVRQAALHATNGQVTASASTHRSRKRATGIELTMQGYGRLGWDTWGIVLEALFQLDPGMIVGQDEYIGHPDFRHKTGFRYDELTMDDRCPHAWGHGGPGVARQCEREGCGAYVPAA